MEFNGAIVSKPLKDELEKVLVPLEEKIDETATNAMEYRGLWNKNTQYYKNDVIRKDFGASNTKGVFIANSDNINSEPSSVGVNPNWRFICPTTQPSLAGVVTGVSLTGTETVLNNDGGVNNFIDSTPEACFDAVLEAQIIRLRIVRYKEDSPEVILVSPVIIGTNAAIIYSIIADKDKANFEAYKTTLTATGATTVSITAPQTIKAIKRDITVTTK